MNEYVCWFLVVVLLLLFTALKELPKMSHVHEL